METPSLPVPEPPAQIYEDLDALEAYLRTIREWHEMRQHLRKDRKRIEDSIARVEQELRACIQAGDEDIAAILRQVRAEFNKRLTAIDLATVCMPGPLGEAAAPPQEPDAAEQVGEQEGPPPPSVEQAPEEEEPQPPIAEPEAREEEPAEPALSPEELAAREERVEELLQWVATIEHGLQALQDAMPSNGNGTARRREAYLLRGLACDLAGVQAIAFQEGLAQRTQPEVQRVLGSLLVMADYAGCPLPDLPVDSLDAGSITPADWQTLAKHYRAMVPAQEAFDWHAAYGEDLTPRHRTDLMNSIAAIQQRVYRMLTTIGRTDPLQQTMYDKLLETAKSVGFLEALNPAVTDKTLDRYADALPERLEKLQKERHDVDEKRRKKEAKDSAIAAVEEWVRQNPEPNACDREALIALVAKCLDVGVPPSSIPLRQALVHHHALLEGEEKLAKLREYIRLERQRQGLDPDEPQTGEGADAGDEDEPEEQDFSEEQREAERVAVAAALLGKNLLLLGGVPKQKVCDVLQDQIGCSARWLRTSKTDKAAKFEADIRKADYVVVVKNLVSRDICDKAREWTKETGRHCVVLRSGYGAVQIVHHLYEYLLGRDP